MSARFRDLSAEEYWYLAWPFLGALICGFVMRVSVPFHPWLYIPPDAISAFADALMVAGVLGLLLELFATRLLIEKVSGDLAEKLVGRGLPPELQSYIKRLVDSDIVRDHYVKVYKLSLVENGDKVRVEVTTSFDVKNYSDAAVEYAPIYQDEDVYDPQFMGMEYGIGQNRFVDTVQEQDTNTKVLTVKGKKKIRLQPSRRDSKAVCEVVIRHCLKMPSEYTDVTNFAAPTMGVNLRTESLPPELDFFSDGENTFSNLPSGDKSWHFDRSFVTGQNFRVWWFKKKG
jgi:hypothetical protein